MEERPPSFDRALRMAYRLLAARARSSQEVRARLLQKGFERPLVDEVLANLRHLDYLDDKDFARQWARHLAVNRLSGDIRIAADLREKGIPTTLAQAAIARAREEITQRGAAAKLLKKHLGDRKITDLDMKEKRRIFQHLMGKGFPGALIREMLHHTDEESVHDDDGQ